MATSTRRSICLNCEHSHCPFAPPESFGNIVVTPGQYTAFSDYGFLTKGSVEMLPLVILVVGYTIVGATIVVMSAVAVGRDGSES